MVLSAVIGRHGVFVHDERDQVIGRSLQLHGEWAEEEIYLLSTLVRSGDAVFDIGANVGTHTIALSRMVGAAGKVISIDGQARASDLLSFNIQINGADIVRRFEGVAGRKCQIVFEGEDTGESPNIGAVTFRNLEASAQHSKPVSLSRPIAMFTVDSVKCSICRLLKIDVEGMEFEVLTGALATIGANRPFIYFEQASNLNFKEFYQLFQSINYRLFIHAANPFNANNFAGSTVNIFGGTRECNILAVPTEFKYAPPPAITLNEIVSPEYESPTTLVPEGWPLPANAYQHISPVLPRLAVSIPPELYSDGTLSQHYQNLNAKYTALRDDRILAQRIMEHQAQELEELPRKTRAH